MSYPIRFTEEALQEEADAYLFYEKIREGLGEKFLNELEVYLTRVAEYPAYHSYIDATNTIRDVALMIFPFIIIYELKHNYILVYHIHHTSKVPR